MRFMYFVFVFVASSLFVAPQPPASPPMPNFDRPATSPVPGFGRSQRGREIDFAKVLFSRIDADRNGSISIDEFRAALKPSVATSGRTTPRGPRTSPPSGKKGSSSRPPRKKDDSEQLLLF